MICGLRLDITELSRKKHFSNKTILVEQQWIRLQKTTMFKIFLRNLRINCILYDHTYYNIVNNNPDYNN